MVDFFNYDKFVVVAEKEWKLDYAGTPVGNGSRTITFPLTIGDIEWQISSSVSGYLDLLLSCTSVAERSIDQVHAEIHAYARVGNTTLDYGPGLKHLDKQLQARVATPLRHVFKRYDNAVRFNDSIGSIDVSLLFTVRILKDRALLPDFKLDTSMLLGHSGSNLKLRVCDQIFHVNKEVLAAHSEYFRLMFNGKFKEANQAEVELVEHETTDPALFEDFLLVLCVPEALPNRKNLAGLFKLANFYQANNVREKCNRHFRMCREMPVEERYMLALDYGNREMQDSLLCNVDLDNAKRIIAALANDRAESQQQQLASNNKKRRIN